MAQQSRKLRKLRKIVRRVVSILKSNNIRDETDFYNLINTDLREKSEKDFIEVSRRLMGYGGEVCEQLSYRPSKEYKGPTPFMIEINLNRCQTRITLEGSELLKGYSLWVKDVEGNFVQRRERKDYRFSRLLRELKSFI